MKALFLFLAVSMAPTALANPKNAKAAAKAASAKEPAQRIEAACREALKDPDVDSYVDLRDPRKNCQCVSRNLQENTSPEELTALARVHEDDAEAEKRLGNQMRKLDETVVSSCLINPDWKYDPKVAESDQEE